MPSTFKNYNPNQDTVQHDYIGAFNRGRAMQTAFRQGDLQTQQMEMQTAAMPGKIARDEKMDNLNIEHGEKRNTLLEEEIQAAPYRKTIRELSEFGAQMNKAIATEAWTVNQMQGLFDMPLEQAEKAYGKVREKGQQLGIELPEDYDPNSMLDLITKNMKGMNTAEGQIRARISEHRSLAAQLEAKNPDHHMVSVLNTRAKEMEAQLKSRDALLKWQVDRVERAGVETEVGTIMDSLPAGVPYAALSDHDKAEADDAYKLLTKPSMQLTDNQIARTMNEHLPPKADKPLTATQKQKIKEDNLKREDMLGEMISIMPLIGPTTVGTPGKITGMYETVTAFFGNEKQPAKDIERVANKMMSQAWKDLVGGGQLSTGDRQFIRTLIPGEWTDDPRQVRLKMESMMRITGEQIVLTGGDVPMEVRELIKAPGSRQNAIPVVAATAAENMEAIQNMEPGTWVSLSNGQLVQIENQNGRMVLSGTGNPSPYSQQQMEKTPMKMLVE